MDKRDDTGFKPSILRGDFSKPPPALAPLRARSQWVLWRLSWRAGQWKPPFRCDDPYRFASSSDPDSWSAYETAVAAASAADGITYVLTPDDPFAAVDIDHVRDPASGTIEGWAQRLLDQASHSYAEISPSGCGLRIWGTAAGMQLHRKFELETAALELFRRTRKPLTVTGLQLGNSRQLGNIDVLLDRAVMWAQQHQQKLKPIAGTSFTAGTTARYAIDEIERIVREGASDGANRSDTFHAVVGHYLGCGWSIEQIAALLEQHPDGIGERYIAEGRLAGEVKRSAQKYRPQPRQSWSSDWQPEPQPEPESEHPQQEPESDPELEESPQLQLPPMFAHGDSDPRPIKRWTIRKLMPVCGTGLLSGQWGTYKSFMALELAAAVMTGQPFNSYTVRRQCGVLFLPAEGADELRLRLEVMVQERCGGMARAPFRWFEAVPILLHTGSADMLTAMARDAHASLQREFGLPLGLVFIDTIAASAGYVSQGAESDSTIGAQIMGVMRRAAEATDSFWCGVDHFGKNIDLGTRGSSSKEASADLVLACLGNRELSGRVLNLRLAVRKCRGGPSGQEFPFCMRTAPHPKLDEDGEPQETLVVDWTAPAAAPAGPGPDPWGEERRTDARQAMALLKRVLMAKLAEHGTEIDAGGASVRGIDQTLVREEFFQQTPADGTQRQKQDSRRKRFTRAINRAIEKQLIGMREIGAITYLWLLPRQPGEDDEF
jgi:AAA domain